MNEKISHSLDLYDSQNVYTTQFVTGLLRRLGEDNSEIIYCCTKIGEKYIIHIEYKE